MIFVVLPIFGETEPKTERLSWKTDTKTKTQKMFFGKTDTKRKTHKIFLRIRIRKCIRYIRVFQNPIYSIYITLYIVYILWGPNYHISLDSRQSTCSILLHFSSFCSVSKTHKKTWWWNKIRNMLNLLVLLAKI